MQFVYPEMEPGIACIGINDTISFVLSSKSVESATFDMPHFRGSLRYEAGTCAKKARGTGFFRCDANMYPAVMPAATLWLWLSAASC